ncbi:MAG: hypothetical protein WHS82_03320 [Candidatus Methanosuratincola sp.]|uniref:Uncharacterized protein n=1 Tax=Methanosuratincola subterraneus TaxID=2593994 RepID=A0A444L9B9_METS7|nr:MAG: hypothetical protein Metus_0206 [Candidatus Methanosuratincola subterraneus]
MASTRNNQCPLMSGTEEWSKREEFMDEGRRKKKREEVLSNENE